MFKVLTSNYFPQREQKRLENKIKTMEKRKRMGLA